MKKLIAASRQFSINVDPLTTEDGPKTVNSQAVPESNQAVRELPMVPQEEQTTSQAVLRLVAGGLCALQYAICASIH